MNGVTSLRFDVGVELVDSAICKKFGQEVLSLPYIASLVHLRNSSMEVFDSFAFPFVIFSKESDVAKKCEETSSRTHVGLSVVQMASEHRRAARQAVWVFRLEHLHWCIGAISLMRGDLYIDSNISI